MPQLNQDIAAPASSAPEIERQEPERRLRSRGLSRRDWILLPLLSLLTIALLFVGAEVSTRIFWSTEDKGYCVWFDPAEGPHGKPNCTSIEKIPEGQRVVEHFNECGYRSESPCGPKPPGAARIALLGSSIAEGYVIPYEKTVGATMTNLLHAHCGLPVQLENLGAEACLPIYSYRHMGEALKLQPDAVVLIVNPWDLEQDVNPKLLALRDAPMPVNRASAPSARLTFIQRAQLWSRSSRALAVAQHYLLQNRRTFLKIYLGAGGDHGAFLRVPFSRAWERRFEVTEVLIREMAAKSHAAGVPFILVGVPERAQVLLLDEDHPPAGVDPWAFTRRLAQIAQGSGVLYVDGLKVFSTAPDRDDLFYVMDGHPTPEAQQLLGRAAARELMAAKSSVFANCSQPTRGQLRANMR